VSFMSFFSPHPLPLPLVKLYFCAFHE
jgi:hypothetical protein